MKTSEDKLNEALRAALKRKFDHFEEVPDPSLFSKIRARINPNGYWRYFFLSGIAIAILTIGTVMDRYSKVEVSADKRIQSSAVKDSRSGLSLNADAASKKSVAEVVTLPEKSAFAKKGKSTLVNKKLKFIYDKQEQKIYIRSEHLKALVSHKIKEELLAISPEKKADLVPVLQNDERIHEGVIENSGTDLNEIKFPDLVMQRTIFKPVVLDYPVIVLSDIPVNRRLPNMNSGRVSWIFNASTLHTYQILTIPSALGQRFQNFKFPSSFSVQSLGYQFSAGIEKKGLQALVHYSGYKQSYSYEIAGDDYVVESVGATKYNVVRQGEKVHEDRNVKLLGIGVNKQFRWGRNALNAYYLTAGLEYSHALTSRQGIGWVTAGVGKQFAVNRNTIINFGPYAEFSPIKTSGAGDPFFYQPYRVGFSLGMKLGKP